MSWRLDVGLRSLRGPDKTENEDLAAVAGLVLRVDIGRALVARPPTDIPVTVLVADGMGGHVGGRLASTIVVDRLLGDSRLADGEAGIVAAVDDANLALYEAMRRDPGLNGMGSTIVGLCVAPAGLAWTFNVGDSRLLLRDADVGVVQLTVDDAPAQGSGTSATLFQCLGGTSEPAPIAPHVNELEPKPQDRLLLCSDGVADVLSASELATVLWEEPTPALAADRIVAAARDSGTRDDATAVVVDLQPEGSEHGH